MMSHQQRIRNELWRADIYQLLALGFDLPSEKNVSNLAGLLDDFATVAEDHPFSDDLAKLSNILKNEKEELTEEYNRLFVTKSECPASEGSYHLVERGPILGDVSAFYEAFRVKVNSKSGPPDSMKMELGFMYYMALKKVYALENKLTEEFATTADAEKKFLRDHLGRWVPAFADRLCKTTNHSFYKILGSLLTGWMNEECSRFEITPTPLPTSLLPPEKENCIRCASH